jgi:trimeric autotransporter adhesin
MFQVYALDRKTNIPADKMNLTINGNDFNTRDIKAQPTMVGWGGSDNVAVTRYETPAALAAAKNPSWRNLQDMATGSQVSLVSTDSVAVPLPAAVAASIGVPTGTKHVGPF